MAGPADSAAPRPTEVSYFGRVAVALGHCSEAALGKALQNQASLRKNGKDRPIGQIMVALGLLTAAQAKDVADSLGGRPLRCTACDKVARLARMPADGWPACPTCGGRLDESDTGRGDGTKRRPSAPLPAAASPATRREGPPPATPPAPAPDAPADPDAATMRVPGGVSAVRAAPPPPVVKPPATGTGDASRQAPGTFTERYAKPGAGPVRDPGIGDVLGGCEIVRKIGKGGMGSVFEAHHIALNKRVAVKVLAPELAANVELVRRFLQEARAAARIEHPNVVQVMNVGREGPFHYIVMQFVEGLTLGQLVEQRGRLDPRRATEIVRDTALGLAAAHRLGIVHRDVKPGNIILTTDGVTKVADFGLAKEIHGDGDISRTGQVLGSPHYISPEQANGRAVDHRADLYSLGVTAYYCLAGRRPFEGATPLVLLMKHLHEPPPALRDLAPEVPEGHAGVVARLMAKDPDDRYLSCEEVIEDCERLLRGDAPARPLAERRVPRRWGRRLAAAGLALAAGGAATVYAVDRAAFGRWWTAAREALAPAPAGPGPRPGPGTGDPRHAEGETEFERVERAARAAPSPAAAAAAWDGFATRLAETPAGVRAAAAGREAHAAADWPAVAAAVSAEKAAHRYAAARSGLLQFVATHTDTAPARLATAEAEQLRQKEVDHASAARAAFAAAERVATERPDAFAEILTAMDDVIREFPETPEAGKARERRGDVRVAAQAAQGAEGPALAFRAAQEHAAGRPDDYAGITRRYALVAETWPDTDWSRLANERLVALEARRGSDAEAEHGRIATLVGATGAEAARRFRAAAQHWRAFPERYAGTAAAGRAAAEAARLDVAAEQAERAAADALAEAELARQEARDPFTRAAFEPLRTRLAAVSSRWPESRAAERAAAALATLLDDRATAAKAALAATRAAVSPLLAARRFDEAEQLWRTRVCEPFADLPVAADAEVELRGIQQTRYRDEARGKWRDGMAELRALIQRTPDAYEAILGQAELFGRSCPDAELVREAAGLAEETRTRRERAADAAADAVLQLAESRSAEGEHLGALDRLAGYPSAFRGTAAAARIAAATARVHERIRTALAEPGRSLRDDPAKAGIARREAVAAAERYRGSAFEAEARAARDAVLTAADAEAARLATAAEGLEPNDPLEALRLWARAAEAGGPAIAERAAGRRSALAGRQGLAAVRDRLRAGDAAGARDAAAGLRTDPALAHVHPEAAALEAHATALASGMAWVVGAKAPGDGGAPVALAPFYVDRFEVSNADFAAFVAAGGYAEDRWWDAEAGPATAPGGAGRAQRFVDATGRPAPRHWRNGAPPPGRERHPVRGVTWYEARAYARFAGKALPSEAQWAAAAGFDPATGRVRAWPWGDTFDASRAYAGVAETQSPTVPVDAFPEGASPWGCLHMAGNVREWTVDWHDPATRLERAVRGGGAYLLDPAEETRVAARHGKAPHLAGDDVGLRCVRPAPERAVLGLDR